METIQNKFVDAMIEVERHLQSAEYMIKVIMPAVKDQKLLLRALEKLNKGAVLAVSGVLKYEYFYKHISLYQDQKKNLDVFFKKCAYKYGLTIQEKSSLQRLLVLGKRHRESGFEFSRVGKMVILNDDLSTSEITKQMLEEFIFTLRRLIIGIRNVLSKNNS